MSLETFFCGELLRDHHGKFLGGLYNWILFNCMGKILDSSNCNRYGDSVE
jgi:hypothetical protein